MAKKIIQDIVIKKRVIPTSLRPEKKSEDNSFVDMPIKRSRVVTPEDRRAYRENYSQNESDESQRASKQSVLKGLDPLKKKKSKIQSLLKPVFWVLILAVFLFFAGSLVSYFSTAVIKITPQQQFVDTDTSLRAELSANGMSIDREGVLPFEIMQIEQTETYSGKSSGIKQISNKASGQLVVYNTYSSDAQMLVARTRFSAPDGKVYRIKNAVTVPGAKIKDGEIIPSSVEVTVYADEAGEEYNMGLVDFKIPGFKGGPRYEKIYARSKTKMTDGLNGTVAVVTAEDIATAKDNLKVKIKDYLTENIFKQKPEDFLLYDSAVVVDFMEPEDNPRAGDNADTFKYTLNGSITGFLIKKSDMDKGLAKKYLKGGGNEVTIANVDKLKFTLMERDADNRKIVFNLAGRAHFVWNVDNDTLLSELRQVNRKEYDFVFNKYPLVEEAEIIFKPSWWRVIPKKESHIRFEQVLISE